MAFKPKTCATCALKFTPRSGRAKRCDECRELGTRAPAAAAPVRAPAGQVQPDTLLDLLGRVKRDYKGASPEMLRAAVAGFCRARDAGERRTAALYLLDLAAVAIVLADRPDRIAMSPPTLAAVPS